MISIVTVQKYWRNRNYNRVVDVPRNWYVDWKKPNVVSSLGGGVMEKNGHFCRWSITLGDASLAYDSTPRRVGNLHTIPGKYATTKFAE
jgi:hypothetical protein